MRRKPGQVRDAIMNFLGKKREASVGAIHKGIEGELGGNVPKSSVRSYLRLNTPETFTRTGHGKYRIRR